ncbi:MAG: hypothetical protein IANPNBLG_01036 [Bryobacteraceae bacterium]|nr:hypothetical protein [Bryobacteraceae bacterium]
MGALGEAGVCPFNMPDPIVREHANAIRIIKEDLLAHISDALTYISDFPRPMSINSMLIFFAFLEILTAGLPTAAVHRPYSAPPVMVLGGGRCTGNSVSMRVATGALPEGLRLTSAGYFEGVPRQAGLFTFQVRADNECQVVVKTFTLRVEGAPLLIAEPEELEFQYTVGGVLPPPQVARVSSSWRDMAYSIDAEGATWLTLRPLRGRTPVSGAGLSGDPVAVGVDPAKLAPGTYRAFLKVSAWETTNEPRIPVTLVITAAQPR